MMNEVTPQWTTGAARRRILDDAELRSKHPAVRGLGRARRLNREHEHRQIEPGGSHEPAEGGRIASPPDRRPVDPEAARTGTARHTTPPAPEDPERGPSTPSPSVAATRGPVVNDRPNVGLDCVIQANPAHPPFHSRSTGTGPMFKPKTNASEPGRMTPVCASANVLPIVGWPAIGISFTGVKMRMRMSVPDCSDGRTNVLSEKIHLARQCAASSRYRAREHR